MTQFWTSAGILSSLQTLLLALVIYGIFLLVKYLINLRGLVTRFKNMPGPPEMHWLFGSLVKFPKNMHERLMHFIHICNKYGQERGYILLWAPFWQPLITPCSPQVMRKVLKSSEPKALNAAGAYRMLLPWLGEGLLIAGGEKWARNRRLLTPGFHYDTLKPYMEVYNTSTNTLLKKISAYAEKGERFEVFQNICLVTLEVILKCAFSYEEDIQNKGGSNPYVQAVNRLTDGVTYRFQHPLLYPDFIWKRSQIGKQFKKDCDFVHNVAEDVINQRREALSKTKISELGRYLDFLDILLSARDENDVGLSQQEIRAEVDTFLFGGHDTTASAISWILYSLAGHPEYQTKCQEELDEILEGRDSGDIEWADLQKMDYLTMCIKEGLRLHCPVAIVARNTSQEFDIGDRLVPPDTIIQVNIWALHHMENIWPNHMEFIPDRFTKDNIAKMEPFQFVPFAAGPRNCIGQHFAMHEIKVILAKLLRNFTFNLDPDHEIRRNLSAVMRTQTGMFMFAKKRSHGCQEV